MYVLFLLSAWSGEIERWKPLVETVENLTFMPSAFDRRFWLEDIFNCSMSDMNGSVNKL